MDFDGERRRTDGRVRAPVWVPGCEYAAGGLEDPPTPGARAQQQAVKPYTWSTGTTASHEATKILISGSQQPGHEATHLKHGAQQPAMKQRRIYK